MKIKENEEVKILNVNVGNKGLEMLTKISKEKSITRLAYTRALLIKMVDENPDMIINIDTGEDAFYGKCYIQMRVPARIMEKLKNINKRTGITVPRIAGYFVLEALKKGCKI